VAGGSPGTHICSYSGNAHCTEELARVAPVAAAPVAPTPAPTAKPAAPAAVDGGAAASH
jgi:hypothetical protein